MKIISFKDVSNHLVIFSVMDKVKNVFVAEMFSSPELHFADVAKAYISWYSNKWSLPFVPLDELIYSKLNWHVITFCSAIKCMDYATERENSFCWPERRYLLISLFGSKISNLSPSSNKSGSLWTVWKGFLNINSSFI